LTSYIKQLKDLLLNKRVSFEPYNRPQNPHINGIVTIIVKDVIRPPEYNFTFVDEKGDKYEPIYNKPITY